MTAVSRKHAMPFGAEVMENAGVRFRLWAPAQSKIGLLIEGETESLPMIAKGGGWHELTAKHARAGSRYRFILSDGTPVPDPASRFQPEDVHGPSEVIDPGSYSWSDGDWHGRHWDEAVIYELHLGTFTPEGTFRGAAKKLDYLFDLGITAVEIMPVADFPGRRNWGYDGVLLYAPDSIYGRPEDMKAFVDEAHARRIMVFLDVVYNHFGPEGNYLPRYAPTFFTERHKTPWGPAINYDGENSGAVREFMIHNALYWIEEFHLDGLRFDAVHAIIDDSPKHVLKEAAERIRALAGDRLVHLVLENERNQTSLLEPDSAGRPRWFTAQWSDDIHHALHTAATGENGGYYEDFCNDTEKLGRALAEGFAFQGEVVRSRGKTRGELSAHLKPDAFIAFFQNHDQIGNRAFGERITKLAPPEAVRAVGAVYLFLPQIPLLFMGEEWGASEPFPFFCDFSGELAEAVREGRRAEFARFPEFQDPQSRQRIPDPEAEATFLSAKLAWDNARQPFHATCIELYRRALKTRREIMLPFLRAIPGNAASYRVIGRNAVTVCWQLEPMRKLALSANLSNRAVNGFPVLSGMELWKEGDPQADGGFGPWSVRWSVESGAASASTACRRQAGGMEEQ